MTAPKLPSTAYELKDGERYVPVTSLFRIPVLAFAVGVYLPLSTMAAVFVGGLTRWLLTSGFQREEAERRREEGVGGGRLMGVGLAIWVVARGGEPIRGFPLPLPDMAQQGLAALTIAAIVGLPVWHVKRVTD